MAPRQSAAFPCDVAVLGFARTPIGGFQGSLKDFTAPALGAVAARAALERSGAKAGDVDEVFFGNVLSAGLGQAPAKQVALAAGVPNSVPCTTVNKVCASGMKALALGAQSLVAGANSLVLCGGAESMSRVPYLVPRGLRLGEERLRDGLVHDGLWDPYKDQHMGACAELCAQEFGFSREAQDAHAAESYRRAAAAWEAGAFAEEIVGVPQARGVALERDEEVFSSAGGKLVPKGSLEQLAKLRPAFAPKGSAGSVTAGSASTISDGAAALVLASRQRAAELQLRPVAWLRACADAAQAPELFTTAPALAIPKVLAAAGWELKDVDCWEINEAFSVVVLANQQLLGLDPAKVNVLGGAAALGHPIGCSGARIICTLISALRATGGTRGVAAICNGGGGASAVAIELEQDGAKSKLKAPAAIAKL